MDLIAKLPSLAALIFRHLYRDGKMAAPKETDWSANFAHMLGTTTYSYYTILLIHLLFCLLHFCNINALNAYYTQDSLTETSLSSYDCT